MADDITEGGSTSRLDVVKYGDTDRILVNTGGEMAREVNALATLELSDRILQKINNKVESGEQLTDQELQRQKDLQRIKYDSQEEVRNNTDWGDIKVLRHLFGAYRSDRLLRINYDAYSQSTDINRHADLENWQSVKQLNYEELLKLGKSKGEIDYRITDMDNAQQNLADAYPYADVPKPVPPPTPSERGRLQDFLGKIGGKS